MLHIFPARSKTWNDKGEFHVAAVKMSSLRGYGTCVGIFLHFWFLRHMVRKRTCPTRIDLNLLSLLDAVVTTYIIFDAGVFTMNYCTNISSRARALLKQGQPRKRLSSPCERRKAAFLPNDSWFTRIGVWSVANFLSSRQCDQNWSL